MTSIGCRDLKSRFSSLRATDLPGTSKASESRREGRELLSHPSLHSFHKGRN